MRLHAELPKIFCIDARNTTTFFINQGPSISMNRGIQEEVWIGSAKLSFLKVFCCISYIHIDPIVRTKSDAKYIKCTFIRYGVDDFGY